MTTHATPLSTRYILICECSGKEQKAIQAYDILFPNTPIPQVVKGREAITKLASQFNNAHLRAISKLKGSFAYYVEISPDTNKIKKEYDLNTGKRIQ